MGSFTPLLGILLYVCLWCVVCVCPCVCAAHHFARSLLLEYEVVA